jgi:hypothetical protein
MLVQGTGKAIPVQAVEARRVARGRGFHIFSGQSSHRWRQRCQPYARTAFYPQEDSWYSFLSRPRIIVWVEKLGKLKNRMT